MDKGLIAIDFPKSWFKGRQASGGVTVLRPPRGKRLELAAGLNVASDCGAPPVSPREWVLRPATPPLAFNGFGYRVGRSWSD